MQKIHNFNLSIEIYSALGKNNNFPSFSKCTCCGDLLIKNGFYSRYVIHHSKTYLIYIQRFRCKHCNSSFSILPSFLIPNFQRSLCDIFIIIKNYMFNSKFFSYPNSVYFYVKRFINNSIIIASFFRETINSSIIFSNSSYKKAIKLIKMIINQKADTFSKRFFNHFNTSFMAL